MILLLFAVHDNADGMTGTVAVPRSRLTLTRRGRPFDRKTALKRTSPVSIAILAFFPTAQVGFLATCTGLPTHMRVARASITQTVLKYSNKSEHRPRKKSKKRRKKLPLPVHIHRVLRVSRAMGEQRRGRRRHAGPSAELCKAGAGEEFLLEREVAREHRVENYAHGPHVRFGPIVPVPAFLPEHLFFACTMQATRERGARSTESNSDLDRLPPILREDAGSAGDAGARSSPLLVPNTIMHPVGEVAQSPRFGVLPQRTHNRHRPRCLRVVPATFDLFGSVNTSRASPFSVLL